MGRTRPPPPKTELQPHQRWRKGDQVKIIAEITFYSLAGDTDAIDYALYHPTRMGDDRADHEWVRIRYVTCTRKTFERWANGAETF